MSIEPSTLLIGQGEYKVREVGQDYVMTGYPQPDEDGVLYSPLNRAVLLLNTGFITYRLKEDAATAATIPIF
jgi:hypothetical protein